MKKINFDKTKLFNSVQVTGEKVRIVAGQAIDLVKDGGEFVGKQYDSTKLEIDKKRLRPVFALETKLNGENKPSIIRVVNDDKIKGNPACINAMGFEKRIKKIDLLNIFPEYASKAGLEFYPCLKETIYCINPYNSNLYISLDDYFDYLKKAKVDELEMIAHKLGAKHVKITFKEQKSVFVSHQGSTQEKLGKKSKGSKGDKEIQNHAEVTLSNVQEEYSKMEVAAESDFDGNETPLEPQVVYFKNESDIIALVKMRLDASSENKIKSKTYTLKRRNTYEMQEELAINIDVVLKQLGCAGNASVVSKVQSEKRTILEYSIVFRD